MGIKVLNFTGTDAQHLPEAQISRLTTTTTSLSYQKANIKIEALEMLNETVRGEGGQKCPKR